MQEIVKTTYPPGTKLACGHVAPESVGNGSVVAFETITNKSMCFPCADAQHLDELLKLPVGGNHVAFARLGEPHGHAKFLPGVVGQIVSWTGGVLGQIVPGTIRVQRTRGYQDSRGTRIHFRVVVQDAERKALFYASTNGDGLHVSLKRIIDRPDPAGPAPHPKTKEGTRVRKGFFHPNMDKS